jgi:hypothetical protein
MGQALGSYREDLYGEFVGYCRDGNLQKAIEHYRKHWRFIRRLKNKTMEQTIKMSSIPDNAYGNRPAIVEACKNGHIHIAHWLVYDVGIVSLQRFCNEIFYDAIFNTHWDIIQWVRVSARKYIDSSRVITPELFSIVCSKGNLMISRMLYNLSEDKAVLLNGVQVAFDEACKNGHLNIARWLLSLSGRPSINIRKQRKYTDEDLGLIQLEILDN